MYNFKAAFTNTDNLDFPNTGAKDRSGPGVKDGTEFKKELVNDWWGFVQKVLNDAGLTPSGNRETSTTSQILQGFEILFARLAAANAFTRRQSFTPAVLTYGANVDWNLETQQQAELTLTGNAIMNNATGIIHGVPVLLTVVQGTGGQTITWGDKYHFGDKGEPILSVGASAIDYLYFIGRGTVDLDYQGINTGYP